MGLIVGLTGGIGCGKSTVAKLLSQHGAQIIDTDLISHELTGVGGAAITAINSHFGSGFINSEGALDRAKMRNAIFSDSDKKQQLESIMHPLILARVREQLLEFGSHPYVVIVVPLLFNSPIYLKLVQRILVVDCSERQQIIRVMQRSGMSEAEVQNIISQQTSRDERLRRADDVISNEGDIAALATQVERLHSGYILSKS
ncbi:MAG: dephospho-CoA kinase [Gallionella sp.]|nr:dephospho-CoA kinase [Gallionella sp.]